MIRETIPALLFFNGNMIAIGLSLVALSAGMFAFEYDSFLLFLIAEVLAFLAGLSFGCYYVAGVLMALWMNNKDGRVHDANEGEGR